MFEVCADGETFFKFSLKKSFSSISAFDPYERLALLLKGRNRCGSVASRNKYKILPTSNNLTNLFDCAIIQAVLKSS